MAFSKGNETVEVSRKLYIGVAPVFVLGVNPDKKEYERLYGRTPDDEPEYISDTEVDGKTVKQVRISFAVKPDIDDPFVTALVFFVSNAMRYNKDHTKVQVIDKYGRTAWPTLAEAKNHAIPMSSNGNPINIDKDYRPAYMGEEDLTGFIRTWLNIPGVDKWKDGRIIGLIDNPSDAEARLDGIDRYFKGDFRELKDIAGYQPNNRVKCMFGVRTAENGSQYQAVYNRMFMRLGATSYSKFDKDLQEKRNNGAFKTTEFSIEPLHEYTVTPTDFSNETPADNTPSPWDNW